MKRELPTTILLVASGLLTGFFGARYYFFPESVLPAAPSALNLADAAVKGTLIMHIAAMMMAAAYWFWRRREVGYYMAWFIGIMINSVGLLIFLKSGRTFVLLVDVIRGLLLLISLFVYRAGRSSAAPATSTVVAPSA